jgi:hypothetical protein
MIHTSTILDLIKLLNGLFMKEKSIAIAVVGNYKYLRKYFYTFYKNLKLNGHYEGEVLIITSRLTPTFLIKGIRSNSQVKIIRLSKIKFNKSTTIRYKTLNTDDQPNRFATKNFQWFKLNLFDTALKNWKFILYLDVNLTIHHDINPLLNYLPNKKIYARADSYPNYNRKLKTQFDSRQPEYKEINRRYNLEDVNYFQSGLLFFDTSIIKDNTKKEIIELAKQYPISVTNEQGILNLYFQENSIFYEELPEYIDGYLTYYYWKLKDTKIMITKQLVEQYK